MIKNRYQKYLRLQFLRGYCVDFAIKAINCNKTIIFSTSTSSFNTSQYESYFYMKGSDKFDVVTDLLHVSQNTLFKYCYMSNRDTHPIQF